MDRFGKVQKGRGGPGRCEGRGDLARHMAGLAETADDQLSSTLEDKLHGLLELGTQAIRERVERACLVVEDLSSELQDIVGHAPP